MTGEWPTYEGFHKGEKEEEGGRLQIMESINNVYGREKFFKHRFIPLEKVGHVKTTLPQMARFFFFIKEPLLLKAGLGPVLPSLVQKQ